MIDRQRATGKPPLPTDSRLILRTAVRGWSTWRAIQRSWLIVVATVANACMSVTSTVSPCRTLQIDQADEKLVAVCWSDEAAILGAVKSPSLIGSAAPGARELFERFAGDRDGLQVGGAAEPRNMAGFTYRISYPANVQGRAQYQIEIGLPTPLAPGSLLGSTKEVIDFIKAKHPDAGLLDVELMPMAESSFGGVTLHFDKWNLQRLTLEQYR
jgi:hypothetical protein